MATAAQRRAGKLLGQASKKCKGVKGKAKRKACQKAAYRKLKNRR